MSFKTKVFCPAAVTIVLLAGCGGPEAPAVAVEPSERVSAGAPESSAPSVKVALPQKPTSSGAAREIYRLDSFTSLVKKSDLVILGKATQVVPGRNAGSQVGGKLGFRDVTIEVQEVLHGEYALPTLTLEELGWKDGEPFTINQAAWASEGDVMLMGLKSTPNGTSEAGPRYILTSSSARFFLEDDGSVDDNYLEAHEQHEAASFVSEAKTLKRADLIRAIKSAG